MVDVNQEISAMMTEKNVQQKVYKNNVSTQRSALKEENTPDTKAQVPLDILGEDSEEKRRALLQALEREDSKLQFRNTNLEFAMHEKTNQIMVKVVDNNTRQSHVPLQRFLFLAFYINSLH